MTRTEANAHRERRRALQRALRAKGLDAALITDRKATHWLTGFRGTASHLLVFPRSAVFITDFRYIESARADLDGVRVVSQSTPFSGQLHTILESRGVRRLGLEGTVPHDQWKWVKRHAPRGTRLVDVAPDLKRLRAVKDRREIAAIRRAVHLTDEIFADSVRWLRKRVRRGGLTERRVALWLTREFEERGGEGPSFPPIVAAGPNSARPHAVPGSRLVRSGQYLLLDFGLVLDGHCSDMTRTLFVGKPTRKHRRIYDIVLEAQMAALASVRAGVRARDVDAAARDVIRREGYGGHFGHGTGHGVGLEIHEAPRLAAASKETLEAGMVVTIEPGIYLPRFGGVRIEDMAVVRENGAQILTTSPKAFLQI